MQRVRIGIIGAGASTEWAILPALSGPDMATPPDHGAWWNRRPSSFGDIRYHAPARPEVVALYDPDREKAERIASTARVRAVYSDWRLMLREVPLDALLCTAATTTLPEVLQAAAGRVRHVWLDGPPALSSSGARGLHRRQQGRGPVLWCASPLRRAAAHRAALRLAAEKQIGEVTAIHLRWGAALHLAELPRSTPGAAPGGEMASGEVWARFAASYAALDLLLAFSAATQSAARTAIPLQVLVSHNGGATNLWLRLANDVIATALFASSDAWNRPLPVLEICGTEGRSLVCEGGRRLSLHQPRQAAHVMEPPGLAPYVSSANMLGIAEDLKAFLALCAGGQTQVAGDASVTIDSPLWPDAGRVLALWEAARDSVAGGQLIEIAALDDLNGAASSNEKKSTGTPSPTSTERPSDTQNATLPLQLM